MQTEKPARDKRPRPIARVRWLRRVDASEPLSGRVGGRIARHLKRRRIVRGNAA